MDEPRPICPECGSVIDPRSCLVVTSRDEDPFPLSFMEDDFGPDKFSGIYCCSDCVLEAFDRGYPEHRGVAPRENE